jgi:2-polyprenyl-3-methyl-5-hydroxy-6-metoxy-1,4-benzoquinol methylase
VFFALKSCCQKILFFNRRNRSFNAHAYWQERAKKYGRRAVLNLAHGDGEYAQVTEDQKKVLLPLLSAQLLGTEKTILDFGCGPGRFSADLANTIHGSVVGMDISQRLLAMAPRARNVSYRAIPDGVIPANSFKFDVIWVCLVLGGIPEPAVKATCQALESALTPRGLMFLVENTSLQADGSYWFFRTASYYQALFPHLDLQLISTYFDAGEEISILAGRKI